MWSALALHTARSPSGLTQGRYTAASPRTHERIAARAPIRWFTPHDTIPSHDCGALPQTCAVCCAARCREPSPSSPRSCAGGRPQNICAIGSACCACCAMLCAAGAPVMDAALDRGAGSSVLVSGSWSGWSQKSGPPSSRGWAAFGGASPRHEWPKGCLPAVG